jgi:hypothetical protein
MPNVWVNQLENYGMGGINYASAVTGSQTYAASALMS